MSNNQPQQSHHPSADQNLLHKMKNMISGSGTEQQPNRDSSGSYYLPMTKSQDVIFPHTGATFKAFVDTMIPGSLGALDLRVDEYMIWTLDHYFNVQTETGEIKTVPLSAPTAQILDIAAMQLVKEGNVKHPQDFTTYPEGGVFCSLSHGDRLEALEILRQVKLDLNVLPMPYKNNGPFVKNTLIALHTNIMVGYYSEWISFGPTRLALPEDRRVERQLMTWDSVQYPGVSIGYRELRGFLADPMFAEKEK